MSIPQLPLLPEMPAIRPPTPESSVVESSALGDWDFSPTTSRTSNTSPPVSRTGSPHGKFLIPRMKLPSIDLTADHVPIATVKNICFVGAGFVGGPTAAMIAYHNPQITVNVVDLNAERIASWNSQHLPVHEISLLKIVRIARDGTRECTVPLSSAGRSVHLPPRQPNLFFSTSVIEAVAKADIVFICVNTPTKMYGVGAGASADLSALESATISIARNAKPGAIIVEKSTVPCGTAKMISAILSQYRPDNMFEVLSNPEFLAEGVAVENLMYPDRVLIGGTRTAPGLSAAATLGSVYAAWVPTGRILTVNTFSSELTKLIANAMLAQRISSINAVSALCEELGADVENVCSAIGTDTRLGPKFLHAGVGFGGSCFEKDILNLSYLARTLYLDEVADYWLSILNINRYQRDRFTQTVIRKLNGTLRGKKIAIFGFAFKDRTNDTRNSVAVHIIAQLVAEQPREIAVFDPGCQVEEIEEEIRNFIKDPIQMSRIRVYPSWKDPVDQAAAVCILTPWDNFRGPLPRVVLPSPNTLIRRMDGPTLSRLLDGNSSGPTEMDILDLERLILSQKGMVDVDDPLYRLSAQSPCEKGCKHCRAAEIVGNGDDPVEWEEVAKLMGESTWVFDGRNVVDSRKLRRLGFKVHSIGKGLWR
ncbi:UDP-glucose/GDP-mannose dehydrogenase family, NAD binding domain-containing protein [Whalleya microplaca]|nr:UDP-glucose/GDP-mannose dehydrogenase family, NAD binding domain-containing protein [Whalleya microplaca]